MLDGEEKAKARKMLIALREVVRRAWWTLAATPDPDLSFFKVGSWPFSVVDSVHEAYAYQTTRVRRFVPSAEDMSRMEVVMVWMSWLRRTEGELAIKRLIGWSMDVPLWRMGERERCGERMIRYRIDSSLNEVLKAFGDMDAEPPAIEEIDDDRFTERFFTEKPTQFSSSTIEPGKVWIDGIGWMFRGKSWNKGDKLAEKFRD